MCSPVLGRAVSQETALNDLFFILVIPREPITDFDSFFQQSHDSIPSRNFVVEGELLQIYLLGKNFKNKDVNSLMSFYSTFQIRASLSEHNSKFTQAPGIDRRKKSILDPLAPHVSSTNHLRNSADSVRALPNGDVVFMTKCFIGVKREYLNKQITLSAHIIAPYSSPDLAKLLQAEGEGGRLLELPYVEELISSRTVSLSVELLSPLQMRVRQVHTGNKMLISIAAENTTTSQSVSLPIRIHSLELVRDVTAHRIPDPKFGPAKSRSGEKVDAVPAHRDFRTYFDISTAQMPSFPVELSSGSEHDFVIALEPKLDSYAKLQQHHLYHLHHHNTTLSTLSSSSLLSNSNSPFPSPVVQSNNPIHNNNNNATKETSTGMITSSSPPVQFTRDFIGLIELTYSTPPIHGFIVIRHELRWSLPECKEFLFSTTCESPVVRNRSFAVCFTVTNLSEKLQDLALTVPEIDSSRGKLRIGQKEANIIRRTTSEQLVGNRRDVMCFQHTVELGKVKPKGSASVNVNFVALREGLISLSNLQIVERETNRVYHTREACEVFVINEEENVSEGEKKE